MLPKISQVRVTTAHPLSSSRPAASRASVARPKLTKAAPDDRPLDRYIDEVVASAPPLSAEQRDRLALLLRGAS